MQGFDSQRATKLSIDELELELVSAREFHKIFGGTPYYFGDMRKKVENSMQCCVDVWETHIRMLENEILERTLLKAK